VGELWKNGWLDLDAVWGGEWGRLRDGCIRWDSQLEREGEVCFLRRAGFLAIGLNGVLSVF